jgi:microcystin-dependent protein
MMPFFLPVGTILAYAGPLADTDGNAADIAQIRANLASQGWLFCDGSSLSCADYAQLYGVIGSAYGGGGTNFNLPDLRGRFIRGVDGGAGRDPAFSASPAACDARTASGSNGNTGDMVGSVQSDAFQGHEHDYTAMMEAPDPVQSGPGITPYIPDPVPAATTSMETETGMGTPNVSTETRPANIYLNYIIRFF